MKNISTWLQSEIEKAYGLKNPETINVVEDDDGEGWEKEHILLQLNNLLGVDLITELAISAYQIVPRWATFRFWNLDWFIIPRNKDWFIAYRLIQESPDDDFDLDYYPQLTPNREPSSISGYNLRTELLDALSTCMEENWSRSDWS
jgi:hypothetical protein